MMHLALGAPVRPGFLLGRLCGDVGIVGFVRPGVCGPTLPARLFRSTLGLRSRCSILFLLPLEIRRSTSTCHFCLALSRRRTHEQDAPGRLCVMSNPHGSARTLPPRATRETTPSAGLSAAAQAHCQEMASSNGAESSPTTATMTPGLRSPLASVRGIGRGHLDLRSLRMPHKCLADLQQGTCEASRRPRHASCVVRARPRSLVRRRVRERTHDRGAGT